MKYHAWLDAPWSCDNVDMQHVLWIWSSGWIKRDFPSGKFFLGGRPYPVYPVYRDENWKK